MQHSRATAPDQGVDAASERRGGARRRPVRVRVMRHVVSFRTLSLVPLLVFVALFAVYPLGQLVRMGFSTVTLQSGQFLWEFSGLTNARRMFGDDIFFVALRNTFLFVVVTTAAQVVLGTALAVSIDRARVFGRVAKNVLLWPAILAPVVVSVVWWFMLSPEFGALNYMLDAIGLPRQGWLGSSQWALPALMLVDIWHWTPLVFLIVYAGLQAIDRTLIEAAYVDGANQRRVVRHVLIPLLVPAIVTAALIRIILAFKVFDEVYLLTSGGPGISTMVLSLYIRDVFFGRQDMGYGAFLGLAVVAVMIVIFAVVYAVSAVRRRTAGGTT